MEGALGTPAVLESEAGVCLIFVDPRKRLSRQ